MHSFHLFQNEQTFKLEDVVDNLNGQKSIRVKRVLFNAGYFNISSATEIDWFTQIDGRPAFTTDKPPLIPAEFLSDVHITTPDRDFIERLLPDIPYHYLFNDENVLQKTINDLIKAYEDDRLESVLESNKRKRAIIAERRGLILAAMNSEITKTELELNTLQSLVRILFVRERKIFEGEELALKFIEGEMGASELSELRDSREAGVIIEEVLS